MNTPKAAAWPPRFIAVYDRGVFEYTTDEMHIPPDAFGIGKTRVAYLSEQEHQATVSALEEKLGVARNVMWDSIARTTQDNTITAPLREFLKNEEALAEIDK